MMKEYFCDYLYFIQLGMFVYEFSMAILMIIT